MRQFLYILIGLLFCSCSMTKYVPDGQYLLDDVEIKSDNKDVDVVNLEDYLRQKPNSTFLPVIGRVRLGIYNMSGQDTTKFYNRWLRNLGQAPVIYSPSQTLISANQLEKELSNEGYLDAEVDTLLKFGDKKVKVTYEITSHEPYRIRNYEQTIDDPAIARILSRAQRFSNVKTGNLFDKALLEDERDKMNTLLRNFGYYTFSKEFLYYKADTTLNSHQVDLYLSLYPSPDSLGYDRYRIRNVTILSGYDPTVDYNKYIFQNPDTTYREGVAIVHGRNNFLRNSTLLRNTFIRPGRFYSDMAASRTYSSFNSINAIKQTTVRFTPVESNDSIKLLDAQVTLAPGNVHWVEAALDGTNSAGDIGVAPSIAYRHQNLFNGGEILSVRLRGAYEFISGKQSTDLFNQNYYEYGIETSLSFPQFLFPWIPKKWRDQPGASTQISLGLNNQHRSEYTRQFFNAGYTFRWMSSRNRLNHSLDLIDINYVRMPWVSPEFGEFLNTGNAILRETYKNQLISRTAYNVTYTQVTGFRYPRNSYTLRGGVDVAGLLPRLVTTITKPTKNSDGQYEIVGIPYAEYLKGDVSFAQTRNFDRRKSLAYRIGIGVASPFGNSNVIPYERRYFSGGANSVRGWNTRRLGPGSYQTTDSTSFVNQAGDVKLDINVEMRGKISDLIELAGFIDAGNIWTIKDYSDAGQAGGQFKFSKFYKEIALAYGLGIRFDLNFLVLRLDFGVKAYDPGKDEGADRWVILKPRLSRMAWHFGIGYPF